MALARANLYGFLSAVFSAPPSAELLATLRDGSLPDILGEPGWASAGGPSVGFGDAEPAPEELAVAFTRLMVGPGGGYVPPYGSIYLDREGRTSELSGDFEGRDRRGDRAQLWGPSTVAMGQLYRSAGLALVNGQVPDHLGIELAFMHHLCAREANAAAEGDGAAVEQWRSRQVAVLHDHLGRWVPSWAAAVEWAAAHPFYAAMTRLAAEFLAWDAKSL